MTFILFHRFRFHNPYPSHTTRRTLSFISYSEKLSVLRVLMVVKNAYLTMIFICPMI